MGMDEFAHLRDPHRDPEMMLARTLAQWGGRKDLWVFGYASLIWNPGFEFAEARMARVYGHHRALKMWSRINRGTPQVPGLVFTLLWGGSCQGVAFRVARAQGEAVLRTLWAREMPTGVYDPLWLQCHTARGKVQALAFVLPRNSPSHTGTLSAQQYAQIFAQAQGRYGSTLDYALQTYASLSALGIEDRSLRAMLAASKPDG
jgi:glutathione-specific gamma-glutamylcyclotransferase